MASPLGSASAIAMLLATIATWGQWNYRQEVSLTQDDSADLETEMSGNDALLKPTLTSGLSDISVKVAAAYAGDFDAPNSITSTFGIWRQDQNLPWQKLLAFIAVDIFLVSVLFFCAYCRRRTWKLSDGYSGGDGAEPTFANTGSLADERPIVSDVLLAAKEPTVDAIRQQSDDALDKDSQARALAVEFCTENPVSAPSEKPPQASEPEPESPPAPESKLPFSPTQRNASQKGVAIQFHVRVGDTQPGEQVYVVGDLPSLGEWSLERALACTSGPDLFPVWTSEVIVVDTSITMVQFKLVICGNGRAPRWEGGENRELSLTEGAGISVECAWGDSVVVAKAS